MSLKLSREQLYELVWSQPMRLLSMQIGISDVAIAKNCRRLDVPVPQRGYWAKRQAGQSVKQVALSPRDLGTINYVEMSGTPKPALLNWLAGIQASNEAGEESIEALAERFRMRLGKIACPRDFANVHPEIDKLLKKDSELRQSHPGSPYSWHQPKFETAIEKRRLRILNGIFLGLAKVGGRLSVRGEHARELSISVGHASVSFLLDRAPQPAKATKSATPPSRVGLTLKVDTTRSLPGVVLQWEDQDSLPLESQLAEIIVGLAIAGLQFHRLRQAEHAAWVERLREQEELAVERQQLEAERQEAERRAGIERAKVQALRQDASDWEAAAKIRSYVAAALSAETDISSCQRLETWSRWALDEAQKMDPIASGRLLGL